MGCAKEKNIRHRHTQLLSEVSPHDPPSPSFPAHHGHLLSTATRYFKADVYREKKNLYSPNYRGMMYKATKALFKVGDRDTERGNGISEAQPLSTVSRSTRSVTESSRQTKSTHRVERRTPQPSKGQRGGRDLSLTNQIKCE